jgi:hypothetical protein
MSVHIAKPEHEMLYADLCALVSKHADKLSAHELLAVAANMLGKLVAMQDQRTMTPTIAMEIIVRNIECGNKQVLDQLMQSKGKA